MAWGMRNAIVVALSLLGSVAAAAPRADEGTARAASADRPKLGLAVSGSWDWSRSFGASLYAGFAGHHAIRGNVAAWDHDGSDLNDFFLALSGNGDESSYSGRTFDLGIGYQYFPRRLYDGLSLEAGVLVRSIDQTDDESFFNSRATRTRARAIAGRALIGWSWLFGDRVFLATAVGLSRGRYVGKEEVTAYRNDEPYMTEVEDLSEDRFAPEAYFRLGVAFDL
jgi:hypothetical protein